MNRIIHRFQGKHPGPLVLVFGALHGNETAGVQALEIVGRMLDEKHREHPDFGFCGNLLGILGNRQAYLAGQRFSEKDLNRQWTAENLRRIGQNEPAGLVGEDLEIAELTSLIHTVIGELKPETLYILDLHTTSAEGGIFCIPTDEGESLRLAKALHAPVILDLLKGVEGTLLQYAAEGHLQAGGFPKRTVGAAFEAGQHQDSQSVGRSVSAVLHCLRAAGCLRNELPETQYDAILAEYSAGLPGVTRLLYVHHIRPGDQFRMRPGYLNFQPVEKGEPLADDVGGPIPAPYDGRILMPLYQPKGSDGFFIIRDV